MDSQTVSFEDQQAPTDTSLIPHSIQALLQQKSEQKQKQQQQHEQHAGLPTFCLFGEPLVCLSLNGEERLCLAQISARLLRDYSYNEIHNRRVALGITCVQCSPRQLEMLRRVGAMPLSSRRCGTITKREAQRLVESFLAQQQHQQQHQQGQQSQWPRRPRLPDNFTFEVMHHCGWGCTGYFNPARYNSSRAKCVQCAFCQIFFSPNKFIFHYHNIAETGDRHAVSKYRHPDAANFNAWRRHLLLADPDPPEHILFAWEDVKAMFNGGSRVRKSSSSSHTHHHHHHRRGGGGGDIIDSPERSREESERAPRDVVLCDSPPKRRRPSLGNQPFFSPSHLTAQSHPPPNLFPPRLLLTDSFFPTQRQVLGTLNIGVRGGVSVLPEQLSFGSSPILTTWTANLREYIEKVAKGIFLPPPPPPPPEDN